MSQPTSSILGTARQRIERLEADGSRDNVALRTELGQLLLQLVRIAHSHDIDLKEAAAAALARDSAC
jgi:NTP pyrophosphatase (non-canonical NTP hydrolase)